jgi:ATP-binding cassette subfamily B protein
LRQPLFEAIAAMGVAAVLWYGGVQVLDGKLTIGELVAFNAYLLLLRMPIQMLGFTVSIFARATASGDRIFEILDRQSEVQEKPDAVFPRRIDGAVDFENVEFAYEGEDVLRGISFSVRPGQVLGIVGGTGSGKSTVINLLPRFYDVTSGKILVDGRDVRDYRTAPLRESIGIVSQETFLFGASLRENISYGRPDATEAGILLAAEAAQLDDFISSLPEGLDTVIGERGTTLSGGQKQRVAIARALLLDPRILILDESTSSVDTETERALQEALSGLMKGRTTLIISQRIASVAGADEIVVLDKGRIVQRGRHTDLLENQGLYRDMYQMQVDSESAVSAEPSGVADL